MKFKTFKPKKPTRTFLEEAPKIKEKYIDFFNSIREELIEELYLDWEEKALFSLYLKPEISLEELRPENIDQFFNH